MTNMDTIIDKELDHYEKRSAADIEALTAKLIGLMRINEWSELHIARCFGEVTVQVLEDDYSRQSYVAAKFDEPGDAL